MDSKCKNRNYFWHLGCIIVIFSFGPTHLLAQYHFSFEPGSESGPEVFPGSSWKQVPEDRWNLSTDGAIEGSYSLHHAYDNPESGCDFLLLNHHRPGDWDSLQCSFRLRHGYAPSSANNWQLALLANFDKEHVELEEGIVVGVNYTGSDDRIRIWQVQGGQSTEICLTSVNYQEEVGTESAPQFRLEWQKDGLLSLYYTKDPFLEVPVKIGSCRPAHVPGGRQLVLRYEYSSARDRMLWLDELILEGNFSRDSLPPRVISLEVKSENSLKLVFTEAVVDAEVGTFLLGDSKGKVIRSGGEEVVLEFPDPFPNRRPLELRIGKLCDADQNCLGDTLLTFMRNEAVWGDVVINEILFDPDPPVRLPEEEFLEVYNRSDYPQDLGSWRLDVGSRSYLLGELMVAESDTAGSTQTLFPGGYQVLKGMALPNQGSVLALYNEFGNLVHGVSYRVPWDAPDWKKEGGWALESPDPDQVCLVSWNWAYAEDPRGGSPGAKNSIDASVRDREAPRLLYWGYGGKGELVLHFSEPVRLIGLDGEDFRVKPGGHIPLEVTLSIPLSTRVLLRFEEDLQQGQIYTMEVPALSDCQGNLSRKEILQGGKPRLPAYGDLFVNEIMYCPLDGNPEFVELYNPGPGYYDLQDLAIQVSGPGEVPGGLYPLSTDSRLFLPGQYLVLSSGVDWLKQAYGLVPSGSWVEVEHMPGLKNAGGTVYLCDRSGARVDLAAYSEAMHMDILSDTKGISLERLSRDRSGSDPKNWHSAASIAGYATPGEANSQALEVHADSDLLVVDPEVFSPDNDGFRDVLTITTQTRAPGWLISLWITDLSGVLVRQLANNHISASSFPYSWDGEQEDGSMVGAGIYVVHLWAFHPDSGESLKKRAAIGVIYR